MFNIVDYEFRKGSLHNKLVLNKMCLLSMYESVLLKPECNLEQILEQMHWLVLLNSIAFKTLQSNSPQAVRMQY